MKVKLRGVRGSIPTPLSNELLQDKLESVLKHVTPNDIKDEKTIKTFLDSYRLSRTFGGNSSCVEVQNGDEIYIFDAGSGIRSAGLDIMKNLSAKKINIFMSHFHWDHICGLPFFTPIYVPGTKINIWAGHKNVESLLAGQMSRDWFPVHWKQLMSDITCNHLKLKRKESVNIESAEISMMPMIHPNRAYGYSMVIGDKKICYLTDTEITKNLEKVTPIYREFIDGADLVIVDAMYGFLEYHGHVNFGHSTIFNWIDCLKEAKVGDLVIFHHDPLATDEQIIALEEDARQYVELMAPESTMNIVAGYEGQTWEL